MLSTLSYRASRRAFFIAVLALFSSAWHAAALAQGASSGDPVYASASGVSCNGTNQTSAINAVVAGNQGRQIIFPAGVCLYDGGAVLSDGTVIVGSGRNSTVFKATLGSASFLFKLAGTGAGLRSLKFDAATTQTGGSYVILAGPESYIEDFEIAHDFNGILMTGSVSRIRHGRFGDGASGAVRIRAEGGDTSQLIDDVLMGAQAGPQPLVGIRVRNSGALIISNTSVITHSYGLLVDPYSNIASAGDSGNVTSLWVHHCFFDTSSTNGIRIGPTGTGSVVRSRFDSVWASSAGGDGVVVSNGGSGLISGLSFDSPHLILNGGSGFTTGGAVADVTISGGDIASNQYGIWLSSGSNGVRVINSTVGVGAGVSGNANFAIVLTAGTDYITLANNDFRGNGVGVLSNGAPSSNQFFKNNIGLTAAGPP